MSAKVEQYSNDLDSDGYRDGSAFIQDLLFQLDQRLLHLVEKSHTQNVAPMELGLRGLVITDNEIDEYLKPNSLGTEQHHHESSAGTQGIWQQVESRIRLSREAGIVLPLLTVRERFNLSDFETECLLGCLATEVDKKYEKIYAYLNDDITRKYPTPWLLISLFSEAQNWPIFYRRFFSDQSPLIKNRLLKWMDKSLTNVPLMGRGLCVDEGVIRFILQEGGLSPEVEQSRYIPEYSPLVVEIWEATAPNEAFGSILENHLAILKKQQHSSPLLLELKGPAGTGRYFDCVRCCSLYGFEILAIDCRCLLVSENPQKLLSLIFRDSILHLAPLVFVDFHLLTEQSDKTRAVQLALTRSDISLGWVTFFLVSTSDEAAKLFAPYRIQSVDFTGRQDYKQRISNWRMVLEKYSELGSQQIDTLADTLAAKFRLSPGKIAETFLCSVNGSEVASLQGAELSKTLHYYAGRLCTPKLGTLAERFKPIARWDSLVLPDRQSRLLRDITRQVRYRRKVLEEWCFAQTMNRGKGVAALFFGPSGTGKTMAVEVIANELEMEVFRIDLSSVVSKYIGETEKNLSKIFREAQDSDVVLFFDEADALFGKRSEIKDAHDRYANIETNYLLQQIENYDGIVILATNMRQNMDKAFIRRIHIAIGFELPGPEDRLRIWNKVLPQSAPQDADIDFEFLARGFELSGGHVRNIGLAAAFLAAEEGAPISMRHLVVGVQRELHKSGRRWFKEDFGACAHYLD